MYMKYLYVYLEKNGLFTFAERPLFAFRRGRVGLGVNV